MYHITPHTSTTRSKRFIKDEKHLTSGSEVKMTLYFFSGKKLAFKVNVQIGAKSVPKIVLVAKEVLDLIAMHNVLTS